MGDNDKCDGLGDIYKSVDEASARESKITSTTPPSKPPKKTTTSSNPFNEDDEVKLFNKKLENVKKINNLIARQVAKRENARSEEELKALNEGLERLRDERNAESALAGNLLRGDKVKNYIQGLRTDQMNVLSARAGSEVGAAMANEIKATHAAGYTGLSTLKREGKNYQEIGENYWKQIMGPIEDAELS